MALSSSTFSGFSLSQSTVKPVLVITLGSLLQMVLQLSIQTLIARQFGTSADANAYEAAVVLPLAIAASLGLPIGSVLIPIVSHAEHASGSAGAWSACTRFGLGIGLTTLVLASLLLLAAPVIMPLVFSENAVAIRLLRILAWLLPANVMTAYCQAVHNWQGRFAIPSIAGVVGPGLTLVMIAMAGTTLTIDRVAMAAVAGAIANVAVQLPGLLPAFRWGTSHGTLSKALRLLMPLLIGGLYVRLDPVIDRALGSPLGEGVIASMGYSSRVINAALAVVVGGLAVVAFPRMAKAAQLSSTELAREIADVLRAVVTLLVPATGALWFFGADLIHDLFERGRFTAEDTARVAILVRCSLGVLIGGSLTEIGSRAFYARHNTKWPTIIGVSCFTVAVGLKFLFSRSFGAPGILVATSVGWFAASAFQFGVLSSQLGLGMVAGVARRILLAAVGTAVACVLGSIVVSAGLPMSSVWGGLAGLAVYVGVVFVGIRWESRQTPPAVNAETLTSEELAERPSSVNLP